MTADSVTRFGYSRGLNGCNSFFLAYVTSDFRRRRREKGKTSPNEESANQYVQSICIPLSTMSL